MRLPSGSLPEIGRCGCGAIVRANYFRDLESYREFYQSGLCQSCQDSVFLATYEVDGQVHRGSIRQGAVIGVSEGCSSADIDELCLVPFIFTVPECRIAWEPRYIVRAGPALTPVDVWDVLELMRPVLDGCQVRVHEVDGVGSALVSERLGAVDLIVALERHSLDVLDSACGGLPEPAACVGVSEEVDCQAFLERPLIPLGAFVRTQFRRASPWWCTTVDPALPLSACAVLGALLAGIGLATADRRGVLDGVLPACRASRVCSGALR